jgi:PAS domain S-box-containing protein
MAPGALKRIFSATPAAKNLDLVAALPFSFFWKDTDLRYLGCNEAFARDLEFSSPDEIIGKSDSDLFSPRVASLLEATGLEILSGQGGNQINEINGLLPLQPETGMTIVTGPLTNHSGEVDGIFGLLVPPGFTVSADRKRHESDEKYRTLFEATNEGMWLIQDQMFTNANPAAAEILGYSNAEELSNTHPSELSPEFQPDGQSSFEKANHMMALAHEKGKLRFEWDHKRKNGEVFPVEVTLTKVPIEGQEILMCSWRDITELKNAERILLGAKEKAVETTQLKSEFLANMSHEIRTPMTGILGMLDLVPREEVSQKQRSYLENARKSANALMDIINDILDLSRLEAGRMSISISAVNVLDILNQVTSLLDPLAQEQGLTLKTRIAENTPQITMIDGSHLRQILLNLVGNALKFTSEGQIVISVHPDAERSVLHFAVEDTGVGIADDKIESVFQRFQQIDGSASRRYEGTGLGLSICKELIDLHGGNIGVESEFDQGSRFWFSLPFEPAGLIQPQETNTGSSEETQDLAGLHILVAEDNAINQMVISAVLESLGASFEVFDDGEKILERLAAPANALQAPDLVLMDIQMPVMGGIEAMQKIRALSSTASALPILAVTAHAMTGQKEEYLAAGMDGYVSKPILAEDLISEIWKSRRSRSSL